MSTWLAENPELLEAALEIVDTWDGGYEWTGDASAPALTTGSSDGSESGDGTDDFLSSSSDGAKSDPTDSRRSNGAPRLPPLVVKSMKVKASDGNQDQKRQPTTRRSTHHRRRTEIDHLRTKTAELERQLAQIKNVKRTRRAFLTQGKDDHARAMVWRDMATQQQQLRAIAESTHVKLRTRVEAQVRMARGLARLMQKAQQLENEKLIQPSEMPRVQFTRAIDVSEADQLRRIMAIREGTDAVFSGPEFHGGKMNVIDIQLLQDRPNELLLEVSETWVVPFDQQRTMDALWGFCVKRQQNKWCAPAFIQDVRAQIAETEIVAELTALASIGSVSGRFDGRSIVKRFVGSEPAIVTDFYSVSANSDPGGFAGVRTQEQSCLRVVPIVSDTAVGSTSTRAISRVQFNQRFTIAFAGSGNSRAHASLFADFMRVKLKECIELMRETVETTLLLTPGIPDA